MVRLCTLSAVAATTLLLAATGLAGAFASVAMLAGAVTLFGVAVALCNSGLSES